MNEAFLALPEEKRKKIINAALEVFSRSEYKRASTDDIAARAGISKGLLFYYFHNKKTLYLYLFDYAEQVMRHSVDGTLEEYTDFFELLEYGARKKAEFIRESPYLMDFFIRAFYSTNEEISGDMNQTMQSKLNSAFTDYFSKLDFSRFREGVDPGYLVRMLTWMTDGYLHQQQMQGLSVGVEDAMREFRIWADMFRKIVYKEEFLNESD